MRYLLLIIFFSSCFSVAGQDCTVCPAGKPITLDASTYPSTATFSWSCTDGFTSSSQVATHNVNEDIVCTLVVTDGSCTETETLDIDVCNCVNNPCVSLNYNQTTDCVDITATGNNNSTVSSDVIRWKTPNTSFQNYTSPICGCDLYQYLDVTPTCQVSGANFRLKVTGLLNRCPGVCNTSSNLRIFYTFPNAGNVTVNSGCSVSEDWLTISPSQLVTNGGSSTAFVVSATPDGDVVSILKWVYNGNGLSCGNITTSIIKQGKIYKEITATRNVTYSDGCPPESCSVDFEVPGVDPCDNMQVYVATINSSNCGNSLFANAFNAATPNTYQWYYNGSAISGATSDVFCLIGQPDGQYCVTVTDSDGCMSSACIVIQPPCTLSATISESNGILTANATNCSGSPSYQWQRWNGSAWINVGTGSTHNTNNLGGDYKVIVTCTNCIAEANYTFTANCTANVSIVNTTTSLTANVTGCSGSGINYLWERWNGSTWVTVQSILSTSTSNTYTPTSDGQYRVTINCGGCSDQVQTSWTSAMPCNISTAILGNTTLCVGDVVNYTRQVTNGSGSITTQWRLDNVVVSNASTYSFTANNSGTFILSVEVTDGNNCVATDQVPITVTQCCSMTTTITPQSANQCSGQPETFNATIVGGSAPYSYQWTSTIGGVQTAQGGGNPKTITLATSGTYTVGVVVTDDDGCQASDDATLTITNCANCNCTPTLSVQGCTLTGGFSGTGCGSFNYQLQYSASGTGWATVLSGAATSGFIHVAQNNGFYRLVIVSSNCAGVQSGTINTTGCDCDCAPSDPIYNSTSCEITWSNPCASDGWTSNLQFLDNSTWTNVGGASPYSPLESGQYRVIFQKTGCADELSTSIAVNLPTPSFTITVPACQVFPELGADCSPNYDYTFIVDDGCDCTSSVNQFNISTNLIIDSWSLVGSCYQSISIANQNSSSVTIHYNHLSTSCPVPMFCQISFGAAYNGYQIIRAVDCFGRQHDLFILMLAC